MFLYVCFYVLFVSFLFVFFFFFFFKQKTAYEMRISDWSSDVCSSDLRDVRLQAVCRQIEARIGEELPLDVIARDAGMSSRTLARLFRRETGIGFQQWRQQARLAEALARLEIGRASGRERVSQNV